MKRFTVTGAWLVAFALTGCSADGHDPSHASETEPIRVFAAASLQPSFEEIAAEFTTAYPHLEVDISAAGSSTLVHNLHAGAPADVLATADEASMQDAHAAELIDPNSQGVFAANTLVGVVPADNPAQVSSLEEATAPGVKLVTCAPQVPCGALSESVAQAAGVDLHPVSEEHQVVEVLGKVRTGEADAGLVYATDARLASEEVTVFPIAQAEQQRNLYPIARTTDAAHPEEADAFIKFVHGERGQAILSSHGFLEP